MQRLEEGTGSILQSGREITGEEIDEIQETVNLFLSLSRCELADTICEHLGWFTATGSCKRDACLKLLERLEAKGFVTLPAKRLSSGRKRPRIVFTSRTDAKAEICGSVGDLVPIRVELVHGGEQTPRTQKVTLSFSVLCRFSGAGIILDNATYKVV